jgi:pimeloyl-[acyl-carrier protein] synthase
MSPVMRASTTAPISKRQVELFNPRDPAFIADPYPIYARLREEDPIHRSFMGAWVLTRHEHVKLAYRDNRFRAPDVPANLRRKNEFLKTRHAAEGFNLDSLEANLSRWFAFLEDPDHQRLRNLVARTFHKRTADSMRDMIRESAEVLIEKVRHKGQMDLIHDFASELPTRVIARVFGIQDEHLPQLFNWMSRLAPVLDPLQSLEALKDMNEASGHFIEFTRDLVAQRRAHPRSDLTTELLQAHEEHGALTDDEIVSTVIHLFATGEQTIIGFLSNSMLALLRNPEQLAMLRKDPAIMDTAIEELLRYDPAFQISSRHAAQDFELEGKAIRKGEQVYLAIGAANRDPRRFDDPDRLDLKRAKNPHLSFGEGRHFCIGAFLARMQARVALETLFERLPGIRLTGEPLRYMGQVTLRRVAALPLAF